MTRAARPALSPHTATEPPARAAFLPAKPPLAAHAATVQRSIQTADLTFIVGPTRDDYDKEQMSAAKKALVQLTSMCTFDLRYFGAPKNKSVYPMVLFTGYDAPCLTC
jgi:hypothetical protein